MRVRFARHTVRLEEAAAFYRDRVGLPEVGRLTDHEGYDGVLLDIPSTGAQLELTSGGCHPPPLTPANPYGQRNTKCYADPDGFQILLTLDGRSTL
jgi:YycE-like protein